MLNFEAALSLAALLIVILTSVAASIMVFAVRERAQIRKRMAHILLARSQNLRLSESLLIAAPRQNVDRVVMTYMPHLEGVRYRLERARINLSIGNYVLLLVVLSVVLGLIIDMGDRVPLYGRPLVMLVGLHLFFDFVVLRFLLLRTRQKILEQLPNAIDMISRALRVGQALDAALRAVSTETAMPLGREFQKMVIQINAGKPVADALTEVSQEAGVRELEYFAIACRAQIESGGNLAEALSSLSEIIRARLNLRLKVSALAAEGKMSAIVISALPVLLLLYFKVANPTYIDPLFTTSTGNTLLFIAFFLIAIGVLVMAHIVRIKV